VTPVISEVRVMDDPGAWRSAGFTVSEDGTVPVGTTRICLVEGDKALPPRRGIAGWTLVGAALPAPAPEGVPGIDGLPTDVEGLADGEDGAEVGEDGAEGGEDGAEGGERRGPTPPVVHANGVIRLDHVVVLTPDLDRTTAALHAVGLEPRRDRAAGLGPDGVPRLQRFFRLGEVILELVGPATPTGDGPARFWGLAYVVDDLDATAESLAERMSRPRDAVQPGRRIAALRPSAGLAVPTAFLTPDRRTAPTA
jgi:hypothetical protein